MFNHFEMIPFLVGFCIGIVGILFWKPKPAIIIKYPHPTNVKDLVYRDPNGVCYKYNVKDVNCDANETTLQPYPLQEGLPTPP